MARIEAGYKGTFSGMPVRLIPIPERQPKISDRTSRSITASFYNQDVHALYMTYGGKWDKLSYQAGLRGEYWRVDTRSLDFDQEFNGKASETFERLF